MSVRAPERSSVRALERSSTRALTLPAPSFHSPPHPSRTISVLYITSATYVAFVAFMSGSYSHTVNVSDWMLLRSPNMFIFEIYFYAMPLVSLIFMGLPFVSTFEVMSLATLGFLVIVPLVNPSEVGNAWVLFESKSVYR